MEKLRAKIKSILNNTPFYTFAKNVYNELKLRCDKYIYLSKRPNSIAIQYSLKELLSQKDEGYYSQYGQDYFLWNNYLKEIQNGFFVDIGANDPIINSNSYFLEKKGWTGVAIDPISRFEKMWKDNRKCQFFCGAVSEESAEIDFIEIQSKQGWEHALSGFKSCVRQEDLNIHKYIEYKVHAKPLKDYIDLKEQVSIIMIDVEGAEIQVLKGIDFEQIKPRFIMIENVSKFGGDDKVRDYIEALGYKSIARIAATDDLFIRQD